MSIVYVPDTKFSFAILYGKAVHIFKNAQFFLAVFDEILAKGVSH